MASDADAQPFEPNAPSAPKAQPLEPQMPRHLTCRLLPSGVRLMALDDDAQPSEPKPRVVMMVTVRPRCPIASPAGPCRVVCV
jgi:hypothetical protein